MKKIICTVFALILCVSALASCSKADEFVPAGFKLASDKKADYSLYVPEGWTVDMSTGVTTAYVSKEDRSNVSFMGFELSDAIINIETPDAEGGEDEAESSDNGNEVPDINTIDEYWAYYSSEFEKTFSDMTYEAEGENMLLSKIAAKKYVYTATVTGSEYKFMQIVAIKDGTVYILTYTARANVFDKHLEDVLDIAGYIELK